MNETASALYALLPSLTTHRSVFSDDADGTQGGASLFQYECFLAGISVFFCRSTVKSEQNEPPPLRFFFASILAFLAYTKKPYDVICAIQLFSYVLPKLLSYFRSRREKKRTKMGEKAVTDQIVKGSEVGKNMFCLGAIVASAMVSLPLCRFLASGEALKIFVLVTPQKVIDFFLYLFPIEELSEAFSIISAFVAPSILRRQMSQLLFVTFNIQVGMGYLGISFLKAEQMRRNELIRMELTSADAEEDRNEEIIDGSKVPSHNGSAFGVKEESMAKQMAKDTQERQLKRSKKFRRGAAPFIFFTVIPYMVQIIVFGNMNQFAFTCVQDDLHRAVRLNELFDHDSHLVAMAADSATSPEAYAQSMDLVVTTAYDLFNRKLFSVPKLLLLPGVIMKQPILLAKIFPFIFLTDYIKGRTVAKITNVIERLEKDAKEIKSIRSKVEAFDMKNAELLQRSGFGATQFTQRRWEELTEQIQNKKLASSLLKRTRGFFLWLQRNFVFSALIDCALANLLAIGKIMSKEIFVFSRAIEDFVDLLLMRSRAESELASMLTEIDKLKELDSVWEKSKERNLLPCHIASSSEPSANRDGIEIKNLQYARGTASVIIDHLIISPGIYALTGANGSGKSTLFRVIMSCESNEKSIDLPQSIVMTSLVEAPLSENENSKESCSVPDEGSKPGDEEDFDGHPLLSIAMPSSDVVEISQTFYWPLYTKPIDWIYQTHLSEIDEMLREHMIRRVAEELDSLSFTQQTQDEESDGVNSSNSTDPNSPLAGSTSTSSKLMIDLQEEKEDWFDDLSGGQKSKVELVRKVFLHDACPKVLLIDETMAPLDPTSKSLVMSKIKNFCKESVVLVIYHTDVGRTSNDHEEVATECVPSNDFFDYNLHLEHHTLSRRPVC